MILPKKIDINKAKAQERKRDIDEGLVLARRIDELRKMRVDLEKNFEIWRTGQYKAIQDGIDQLIEEKNNLKRQNDEARVRRDKLLEPLDLEWQVFHQEKEKLMEAKNEYYLDKERLEDEVKEINRQRQNVVSSLARAKENEKQTEKAKQEAGKLKELASQELYLAKLDVGRQTIESETILSNIKKREKEYEVALQTIEIRENQVNEKESELLIREKELARRSRNLERVEQII